MIGKLVVSSFQIRMAYCVENDVIGKIKQMVTKDAGMWKGEVCVRGATQTFGAYNHAGTHL